MITLDLKCPSCNDAIGPVSLPRPRAAATSYQSCIRRCDRCGIGFSNGDVPTRIFRDPVHNVPEEVRAGALDTLRQSLNTRNLTNKEARFGFETSEDAITWAIFSWLVHEQPQALSGIGRSLGLQATSPPDVFLWGAHVPANGSSPLPTILRERLRALGENEKSLTEPDVMLDFRAQGLVIVEVKHRAANDVQPASGANKFDRYLGDCAAFANAEVVRETGLYELTRNWRVGFELAAARPFRLVNLGPASLFAAPANERLDRFESALACGPDRAFVRLDWPAFFRTLETSAALPPWLTGWLQDRDILT